MQCRDLLKLVGELPSNDIDEQARRLRSALATYLRAALKKPAYFGDSVEEFERPLRTAVQAGTVVRKS